MKSSFYELNVIKMSFSYNLKWAFCGIVVLNLHRAHYICCKALFAENNIVLKTSEKYIERYDNAIYKNQTG